MNQYLKAATLLPFFALAGCGDADNENAQPQSATPAGEERTEIVAGNDESEHASAPVADSTHDDAAQAARAAEIYEDFFEADLKLNPLRATYIGDHRYNDQMPNYLDPAFEQRQRDHHRGYLDEIRKIDPAQLSGQDLLSYQIFVRNRNNDLQALEYPSELIPINQFYNLANMFAQLGSGKGAQPFRTEQDYADWLKRVDQFVTLFDQAIANMRTGVEAGLVQPKVLMERVLPQLQAHLVEDVTESLFAGPLANLPDSMDEESADALRDRYHAAIESKIVPAYQRLHDYIADEYLPHARTTVGMWDIPGGDDWYAFNVRNITTTDLSPDQIHEIGLSEVARIHEQMRGVMNEVGFEGTLEEFFEFTSTDKQFLYDTSEELIEAYNDFRSTVDAATPKLFSVMPKADYEIRAVEPFREKSSSAASYQRAAADGSRPGIFYVNTYDLSARPSWNVESLFLHEAAPGHHFQLSIQQELEDVPRFRRFGGITAYTEGWGLYSESLGKELGVYTDPYQYYGSLAAELWRAIRLVVDTGLHAKQWSRADVLEYMYANAPVTEARAVSEAERFMAIPGQALAYKIGQLKIRELRDRAETALGDQFDVRAFHHEVLKDGAIPLDVLEAKIDNWIASYSES